MYPSPTTGHSPWSVFLIFLRLGLTSFGGPVAHLGFFRQEFVVQRQWLDERRYADLVALCQFLPGPASSQVGMAVGLLRAGYLGALAAWAGFTLPSALLMLFFAVGLSHFGNALPAGLLHGLHVVAVAVVAQAVWGMARSLCPDRWRASLMALTAGVILLWPVAWIQISLIGVAGLVGLMLLPRLQQDEAAAKARPAVDIAPGRTSPDSTTQLRSLLWLAVFAILLMGLPLLAKLSGWVPLQWFAAFFRTGSLVFGGGHVVLPLLESEVVHSGWVNADTFLAGYGLAQAVPGPLFTFAAFLGASLDDAANIPGTGTVTAALLGGVWCLLAIFLPSFLLVAGALPFWEQLRQQRRVQAALAGVNAAVVGLLLAALYQPVWKNAILSPQDAALGLLAFIALMFWKLPPWLVVILCGLGGWGMRGLM